MVVEIQMVVGMEAVLGLYSVQGNDDAEEVRLVELKEKVEFGSWTSRPRF